MLSHFRHSNGFLSHLMAYGASEVASKLSRIFVVVMVARHLGAEQVGLAAAALAVCDIIKSLTEHGIGQKVMAADEADLPSITARAHRLFWQVTAILFLGQLAIGAGFAALGNPIVGGLVALASLEYLFMPGGLVQAALAMREGKLTQTAKIAGTQIVSANLLSVALVFVFPSPLVLVLPRVLTAPIWLIAMRRLRPWTSDPSVPPAPIHGFITFGLPVLGTSLVNAFRLHADKLVIGALLGAEGLGSYFMAFNAGLSIATAYVAAFDKVVFPHLCKGMSADPRSLAAIGLFLITPVVLAQSVFAPSYVPILLGSDWAYISPVVSVLCLTAIPLTLWSTAAAKLRVTGNPGTELAYTFTVTLALLATAFFVAPWGLMGLATAHLAIVTVLLGIGALCILWPSYPTPRNQEVL
ncbi:oligosaccharide flippase family protein [Cognatishimia activa]|uniref:Lipopolysaccharide biosynthesis protein WzxC n=1 Tax=Cognatishimia activa TaxID=1715691 RepID=A0A0P1IWU2_9RHOB|nr:oligosaccharide flippase family protein [Cognatishimia activa]CUI67925.1 Lipopolysaccharide biosynthesis protein WzxC [Cognatishimia activa]CUK26490.1 Lipopolysaccharide biosynthesis protein WzxC [Cognatishimia activa]